MRSTHFLLWLGGEKHAPQGGDGRKKRERTNGFLAIELFSGECYFQANKKAKSEQVAQYFAELAQHCQDQGYQRLDVFLDRNTTHKAKMQQLFAQANTTLTIQVRFRLLPAYSPKLNLVEYAIHLIRQKVLHHADYKTTLSQFESDVKELCKNQKLLTKDQIMNILNHIQSLVPIPTI